MTILRTITQQELMAGTSLCIQFVNWRIPKFTPVARVSILSRKCTVVWKVLLHWEWPCISKALLPANKDVWFKINYIHMCQNLRCLWLSYFVRLYINAFDLDKKLDRSTLIHQETYKHLILFSTTARINIFQESM